MNMFRTLKCWIWKEARFQALYDRGVAKAKRDDLPGAIDDFTAVIESPKAAKDLKALAYFQRALAHSRRGERVWAEEDLESVLLMPNIPSQLRVSVKERLAHWKRRYD
jgi:hypothetical protein